MSGQAPAAAPPASQARLVVDRWLRGEQPTSGLVLLLIFQVNCPGCFLHALPTALELHRRYGPKDPAPGSTQPPAASVVEAVQGSADSAKNAAAVDAGESKENTADASGSGIARAEPESAAAGGGDAPLHAVSSADATGGSESLSVALISTAFEDFDRNTIANTEALLESGTLIGETRRALGTSALSFSLPPSIPVAMDSIIPVADDTIDEATALLSQTIPPEVKRTVPPAVLQDALVRAARQRGSFARTFDGNRSQGTPTWVLYDADAQGDGEGDVGRLLHTFTGHLGVDEFAGLIEKALAHRDVRRV